MATADYSDIIKLLLFAVGRCDRCRRKWADCRCICTVCGLGWYKNCACGTIPAPTEAEELAIKSLEPESLVPPA